MPTILLLDVSLSMSRCVPGVAALSPDADAITRRHLAVCGINTFLDYLAANNKLEFVSLVIFSSLYQQVVPFTRDYAEVRNALGKLDSYNKTCLEAALTGVQAFAEEEWGTSLQCEVILITDGSGSVGEGMVESQGHSLRRGYRLHVLCIATPGEPALVSSEPVYRRLIAEAAAGGVLLTPEGTLCERSVRQMFSLLCENHYTPFTGLLRCGNLRCSVQIFPAPENYDKEEEFEHVKKTVSKELELCGFLDIRDIANPPYRSRHLVLPLPLTSSPVKAESSSGDNDGSEEKEADKSAAFTVLLHGSLKVEQMVGIVEIGEDWYGILYSFADSKKKSNLMLSVFEPGADCLPWLGSMSQLAPALEFDTPQYSDDGRESRSPFPVAPADRRSYTQNCVVWIKNTGLQADIQKILRSAKRLPEKQQHFYKELNRLRSAALSLGFYELLDAMAQLLERECTLLPNSAHPDAALQMTHAASMLRRTDDATRTIVPLRTNFTAAAE